MAEPQDILLEKVCGLYGIGRGADLDALREPVKTYVNYALTSIERGRAAVERLRPYRSLEGARCLDAGCAYGGFLAATVAAGAGEVVGFDLDERLVDIAQAYLNALRVPAGIHRGDVMDGHFLRSLGTFDFISCNDVIEHVPNVSGCIQNLAERLRPGGVLYMAIPNRISTALIRSDPHFHLYGIVLMSRSDAMDYHTIISHTDHYDVGDYFAFEYYDRLLCNCGLKVSVANAPSKTAHWCVRELRADYAALRQENERFTDPRLPLEMVAKARQLVSSVIDLFEADVAEYDAMVHAHQSELATSKSLQIAIRYYMPTWYFIAQKPG